MPPDSSLLPPLAALWGLVWGSFLNVCIFRLPRDLSVLAPRSFCPSCTKPILWYDNIPVFSYLHLRGRCRHCGGKIPVRYGMVELFTAALFFAVVYRYGWSPTALKWLAFESCLVVLFCTDLEHRLLLDEFTIGGGLLGILFAWWIPVHGSVVDLFLATHSVRERSLINALGSGAFFSLPLWAIAKLYERLRHQEDAFGLGDVKLLALLGIYLGFDAGLLALIIGSVGGALFGAVYVMLKRQPWRTATLPFGSFLCAGAALLPFVSRP